MHEDLYTMKPRGIVMYAVDWCPDCRRAKFFLDRRQIPYEVVNVDQDAQGANFVKQVNHGQRSVPTIIFPDGTVLVEPSTDQLTEKFSTS